MNIDKVSFFLAKYAGIIMGITTFFMLQGFLVTHMDEQHKFGRHIAENSGFWETIGAGFTNTFACLLLGMLAGVATGFLVYFIFWPILFGLMRLSKRLDPPKTA